MVKWRSERWRNITKSDQISIHHLLTIGKLTCFDLRKTGAGRLVSEDSTLTAQGRHAALELEVCSQVLAILILNPTRPANIS